MTTSQPTTSTTTWTTRGETTTTTSTKPTTTSTAPTTLIASSPTTTSTTTQATSIIVPTTTSPKQTTSTTSPTRPNPTTVNPTAQPTTTTVSPTATCTTVALTGVSESPCGTCTLLTPTSGNIESLNFPNDYGVYLPNASFINCLYTINASPGRKIRLTFSTFIVETDFDQITVYDGVPPNGTILASGLTGYVIPPAPLTTVATNQMAVIFKTDSNNNAVPLNLVPAKWRATFTVVP